ncbi:hypothetical protein CR158_06985 [Halomonas heilongjiangensis]|uniref:Uncharacterized protein n=1 Tax=Halomonas heilongjiangensis TaxID=1387883 RepID=A0A2N7TFB4_9GAMM|nr:hypothetical protein C1H66_22260 [Halomonas heilongjiangensis]PXX91259.1 hypothetical protein CR158_06985 [Halomonas heilongjiangensis]
MAMAVDRGGSCDVTSGSSRASGGGDGACHSGSGGYGVSNADVAITLGALAVGVFAASTRLATLTGSMRAIHESGVSFGPFVVVCTAPGASFGWIGDAWRGAGVAASVGAGSFMSLLSTGGTSPISGAGRVSSDVAPGAVVPTMVDASTVALVGGGVPGSLSACRAGAAAIVVALDTSSGNSSGAAW